MIVNKKKEMFDFLSFLYYNKIMKLKKRDDKMERKIEEGLWFEYTNFVYGIKVEEQVFQELCDERKLDCKNEDTYHEGQGPSLFRLHHDWDSLDGWWIGDEDNPKGLVIGTNLNRWMENQNDDFKIEILSETLKDVKEYWNDFNQFDSIIEFLKLDANCKPALHLITNRYFLSKKEIQNKYKEFPTIYPQYKDYLEADCWEIREV